jgi:hypothetical protein
MRSRCILAIFLAAFQCGCSTVSSRIQIGNPAFAEDAQKLAGIWMTADGDPFFVRHIKDNELRVASVGWSKNESRFELQEVTVFLTDDDGRRFINVVDPDSEAKSPDYTFLRVTDLTDNSLVFIAPRIDAFSKAVEDGVLPGKIEQNQNSKEVKLAATADQLNSFVDPAKLGDQFDADEGMALHRVQRASAE